MKSGEWFLVVPHNHLEKPMIASRSAVEGGHVRLSHDDEDPDDELYRIDTQSRGLLLSDYWKLVKVRLAPPNPNFTIITVDPRGTK